MRGYNELPLGATYSVQIDRMWVERGPYRFRQHRIVIGLLEFTVLPEWRRPSSTSSAVTSATSTSTSMHTSTPTIIPLSDSDSEMMNHDDSEAAVSDEAMDDCGSDVEISSTDSSQGGTCPPPNEFTQNVDDAYVPSSALSLGGTIVAGLAVVVAVLTGP